MRLLHTTDLRLSTFFGAAVPAYAILSHTWETEEVLFGDIKDPEAPFPSHKAGWKKIVAASARAVEDGYKWIWIDTCCIDKESSAELSEAINSMFKWYRQAHICYAYLYDMNKPGGPPIRFDESRWFERGWTLQELIAPRDVRFYDHGWKQLGSRQGYMPYLTPTWTEHSQDSITFAEVISKRTGVPPLILTRNEMGDCGDLRSPRGPLGFIPGRSHWLEDGRCRHCHHQDQLPTLMARFSIAQRMSWVAKRLTTRKEDLAYCLLGIFGVNMPLLYGEGEQAFMRLQEEIMRISEDQSILAFSIARSPDEPYFSQDNLAPGYPGDLLASSPQVFENSVITTPINQKPSRMNITAKTMELEVILFPCRYEPEYRKSLAFIQEKEWRNIYLAVLDCIYASDLASRPSILIEEMDREAKIFRRIDPDYMTSIGPQTAARDLFNNPTTTNIYMPSTRKKPPYECDLKDQRTEVVRILLKPSHVDTSTAKQTPINPALRILLDPDVRCCHSYPTKHTQAEGGVYIPSVFLAREQIKVKPDMDRCRPCGVLWFKLRDFSFFVEWGVYTAPTDLQHSYSGWCKILDWDEAVKDIPSPWKMNNLYLTLGLGETIFERQAEWYLDRWKFKGRVGERDAKKWPAAAGTTSGYFGKLANMNCTIDIKKVSFLGQEHLQMQVLVRG